MATHAAVARTEARAAAAVARASHGYVPTPPVLAELLTGYPYAMISSLPDGADVLEPSAGEGALTVAIRDAHRYVRVTAIECDEARAAAHTTRTDVEGDPVAVHVTTFEQWTADNPDARFDAAVMNPPFSRPGAPRLWIDHILSAYALLRPGGRLAAVVPSNMTDAGYVPPTKKGQQLRDLVDAHGGVDTVDVARHADGVAAIRAGFPPKVGILWLVAPMPTRTGRPSWVLDRVYVPAVTVTAFRDSARAAVATPAQTYRDWADGGELRTVRYIGTCVLCRRVLWAHDDGMECAVDSVANSILDAADYGKAGPSVGLCMSCHHGGKENVRRAEAAAVGVWRTPTLGEDKTPIAEFRWMAELVNHPGTVPARVFAVQPGELLEQVGDAAPFVRSYPRDVAGAVAERAANRTDLDHYWATKIDGDLFPSYEPDPDRAGQSRITAEGWRRYCSRFDGGDPGRPMPAHLAPPADTAPVVWTLAGRETDDAHAVTLASGSLEHCRRESARRRADGWTGLEVATTADAGGWHTTEDTVRPDPGAFVTHRGKRVRVIPAPGVPGTLRVMVDDVKLWDTPGTVADAHTALSRVIGWMDAAAEPADPPAGRVVDPWAAVV
jgi:hypothetical protein